MKVRLLKNYEKAFEVQDPVTNLRHEKKFGLICKLGHFITM